MEIDEKSRFRMDYVKLNIACRDVSKVPKSTKGTLGLCLYDFGFEREIPKDDNAKAVKATVKVGEDQRPLRDLSLTRQVILVNKTRPMKRVMESYPKMAIIMSLVNSS
jgi:hypothetical protein